MDDIPLDPAAAERALPETYAETMDAFFTDLADQESGDYVTNVKRVLALDYVLLRADVDEYDKTEQARLSRSHRQPYDLVQ
jgi:ABC-type phosphate/phosphonate transport system substrate-binding protein